MKANDDLPLFDYLEVLNDHRPRDGAYNMALDEVLLCRALEQPLLRLYQWARPAVTFGYFEPWQPVAVDYPTHELVRRWTGGGVVDHRSDWTYSLLLPRTHLLTNLPAGESYRLIHEKLRLAMDEIGWPSISLHHDPGKIVESSSRTCFVKPVRYDLVWNGRKVSGAAQRRTRQGLLHQGSVQNMAEDRLPREQLAQSFLAKLANRYQARILGSDVDSAASSLAANKYEVSSWLHRV